MYVYTSGTTGLPKPAVIKNNRYTTNNPSLKKDKKLNESFYFFSSLKKIYWCRLCNVLSGWLK